MTYRYPYSNMPGPGDGRFTPESTSGKNNSAYRHGLRKHPLYKVWLQIKDRCTNPESKSYPYYGGRGIRVCGEWSENPKAFISWAIAKGWANGLQIDRVDNDCDYIPDNCRFVSAMVNNHNRRLMQSSNTSGFCGVSYRKSTARRSTSGYRARATINGNTIRRHALFPTALKAALYRDSWVIAHGGFLKLNFEDLRP